MPTHPDHIGTYKIEMLLREHPFSVSYLATEPGTQAAVIIKLLKKEYMKPHWVGKLKNEASILSHTEHPNIIKCYGQGEDLLGPYLVMEYIEGISLAEFIAEGVLPLKQTLKLTLQISSAVAQLHGLGIVHGGLYPENIVVTSSEEIKLVDFGLAYFYEEELAKEAGKTNLLEIVDKRSYAGDVFDFAAMVYELILGEKSPGHFYPSLMPRCLQKALFSALEPKSEDRYVDIVDIMMAIKECLKNLDRNAERPAREQIEDVYEEISQQQASLLERSPPSLPGLEIGLANHRGVNITGIYYDFFRLKDSSYAIVMAEPVVNKGIAGLLNITMLRGMVHALFQITMAPEELFSYINKSLIQDDIEESFNLSCLILSAHHERFSILSTGQASLFYLAANSTSPQTVSIPHLSLGIDKQAVYRSIEHPWTKGDRLFLSSFAVSTEVSISKNSWTESSFKEALIETNALSPDQQVKSVLSAKKRSVKKNAIDYPLLLMSIAKARP